MKTKRKRSGMLPARLDQARYMVCHMVPTFHWDLDYHNGSKALRRGYTNNETEAWFLAQQLKAEILSRAPALDNLEWVEVFEYTRADHSGLWKEARRFPRWEMRPETSEIPF